MGKASRWLISLLLGFGKKEEKKENKNIIDQAANYNLISSINLTVQPAATPKVKRRWSFGTSSSSSSSRKDSTSFKSSKFNDSIQPPMLDYREHQQNHQVFFTTAPAAVASRSDVENAAATKIQAIFRSYLARKALCALRGLVKLQALARGYLVRKQTTATLHRLHTLMAIQVRARVQRVQNMAEFEEAQQPLVIDRRRPSLQFPRVLNGYKNEHRSEKMNVNDLIKILKREKNGYVNESRFERIEHGFSTSTCYSGNLCEEYSVSSTAQDSPRINYGNNGSSKVYQARASFSYDQQPNYYADYSMPPRDSDYYSFIPKYMAGTESSKAKTTVRSHSEPKQRPKWSIMRQKSNNKQIKRPKNEEMGILRVQHSSNSHSNSKRIASENEDRSSWFVKLYGSTSRSARESTVCE